MTLDQIAYSAKFLLLSEEMQVKEVKMLLMGYNCNECIYSKYGMCVTHREDVRDFFGCHNQ